MPGPGERPPDDGGRPAGSFSAWLGEIGRAIAGEADADVPCDGCTACCTSAQFVHVAPDEVDALAHIPAELLFPAPGLPVGYVLMGYDELGHCPMLQDHRCTIYPHRPRACRSYDCRVFAATGVDPGEDKPAVAERVAAWRFDRPTAADGVAAAACRAAAGYLRAHAGELPLGPAARNPLALAALALRVEPTFVGEVGAGRGPALVEPDVAAVRAAIEAERGR